MLDQYHPRRGYTLTIDKIEPVTSPSSSATAASGSAMTVASAVESLVKVEKVTVQQAKPKNHKKRILDRSPALEDNMAKVSIQTQDDLSVGIGQVRPFPITIPISP